MAQDETKQAELKRRRQNKQPEAAISPQPPQLTEVELLKLRLFLSEQAQFEHQHMLITIQRLSYLKQIDPDGRLGKFDRELVQVQAALGEAKKQYQAVVEAVQSRLDLKMQEYTFDGLTGILRKVE